MSLHSVPASVRANALATLTDTCTIRQPGESKFVPGVGPTTTPGDIVYAGPCSLLPPGGTGDRTDSGADDRMLATRPLILDASHDDGLAAGDIATVDGHGVYWVDSVRDRTHEVTRRIRVIDDTDAAGVPA